MAHVERSTCMTNIEIGTVILHTCVCVVFLFGIVCGFDVRCHLRELFVVYAMLYFSFLILLTIFLCGFVVMS